MIRYDMANSVNRWKIKGLREGMMLGEVASWCREGESNPHDLAAAGF
jgi:hypothetical protein